MGVMKQWQLEQYEEEMGNSDLSWSQIKMVFQYLMQEFPNKVTWSVQDIIKDRQGKGPYDLDWSSIRQMLNNLTEIYYADMCLSDLYDQIAHMSDRYDSLGDKVESAREEAEFREAVSKDD